MKVTLTKPHEHGGHKHPAGACIDVTAAQKARLQQRGKVARAHNDRTPHTTETE